MRNASVGSRGSRGPSQVLGVLLISGGAMWLAASMGLVQISLQGALAALLVLLGVGMIVTRSSGPFLVIGIATVALLAVGSSDLEVGYRDFEGAGERIIAPSDVASLAPEYRMGAGSFLLDLSQLDLPDGVTDVDVGMAIGEMTVIVPRGVDIEGEARVGGGEVVAFQQMLGSGVTVAADLSRRGASPSTLRLDLSLVLGTIEIRRG